MGITVGDSRLSGAVPGVRCTPEQVVIGAEQHLLMSLLTQTMLQKGGQRSIAVENPGYRLLPGTFRNYGYEVIPISLDSEGINLDELTGADVSVAGVSPSHQFPMGVTMPISRRLALLDWAERAGTYLIEDDYDGEFRYSGRPIPSMQGLRENTPVIYMGDSLRCLHLPFAYTIWSYRKNSCLILLRYIERFYSNSRLHVTISGLWNCSCGRGAW